MPWSVCTILSCCLIGVSGRRGDVLKIPCFGKFFEALKVKMWPIVANKPFRDCLFSKDFLGKIDDLL